MLQSISRSKQDTMTLNVVDLTKELVAIKSVSQSVPGQEEDWKAFKPVISDGRLIGRGSCDIKGRLAATIVAATAVDARELEKAVFIVISAVEEIGAYGGLWGFTSGGRVRTF
jgi:hypothetical protein